MLLVSVFKELMVLFTFRVLLGYDFIPLVLGWLAQMPQLL
jgi:hypothetical protein